MGCKSEWRGSDRNKSGMSGSDWRGAAARFSGGGPTLGRAHDLDLSLALATRDRCRLLERTLTSLTLMDTAGARWEVVVADNGSRDATAEVALRFATRLPLRYAHEPTPGKSAALNSVCAALRGRLIAFTDDDVLFDRGWLQAVLHQSRANAEYGVITGPVEASWPCSPRSVHLRHPFAREALSLRTLGESVREMPAGCWPLGCNTVIRRELLDERPFDERRGPIGRGRLIGNDTALMMKLAARGVRFLYVPGARVRHLVQPEQMRPQYLWRRAFQRARTITRLQGVEAARSVGGVPVWMVGRLARAAGRLAAAALGRDDQHRIQREIELADALGMICAAREIDRSRARREFGQIPGQDLLAVPCNPAIS